MKPTTRRAVARMAVQQARTEWADWNRGMERDHCADFIVLTMADRRLLARGTDRDDVQSAINALDSEATS